MATALHHLLNPDGYDDIKAELTRKALESLESLIFDYQRGAIDQITYARALQALDQATSGLIDQDITQAIWEEAKPVQNSQLRAFMKADNLVLISHDRTEGRYVMQAFKIAHTPAPQFKSFDGETDPIAACNNHLTKAINRAKTAGHEEL